MCKLIVSFFVGLLFLVTIIYAMVNLCCGLDGIAVDWFGDWFAFITLRVLLGLVFSLLASGCYVCGGVALGFGWRYW